jgi:DNA-binding NtrC family response regulator
VLDDWPRCPRPWLPQGLTERRLTVSVRGVIPTSKPPRAVSTDLGTIERETIAEVLRECRRYRTRAYKRLVLTRTQLYLRLQKHGVEKPPES